MSRLSRVKIQRRFTVDGFCSAFSFAWDDRFVFHGESHDFWELVFIAGGTVEAIEDDKVYILRENNILLHAPMEFHRIRSAEGTAPYGVIMSFFTTGALPEELKNGVFSLQPEERAEFETIAEKILSFRSDPEALPYAGQESADMLSAFLIRLARGTADRKLSVSPGADKYQQLVADMIARVCENCSLSDFAADHSISLSYLKLLFSKYAGISPKAYYSHLRVQCAAKLLSDGLSVSEIADRMNFSSPSYFTAFFRSHTGLSPTAYRKAAAEK